MCVDLTLQLCSPRIQRAASTAKRMSGQTAQMQSLANDCFWPEAEVDSLKFNSGKQPFEIGTLVGWCVAATG